MSTTTTPVGITFFRGEDPLRADKLNAAFNERVWRKGDTMLGPLILYRDPILYNEAATKQYVDGIVNTITNASVVRTFNGRQGFVQLTSGDVTTALTYTPYNATNPAGYITAAQAASGAPVQSVAGRIGVVTLTHVDITDWDATLTPYALKASPVFTGDPRAPTPTPGDNDTSIATTAFVAAALAGSVAGVSSFNTRTGAVVLSSADVTTALTYTPYNATNPAGYITSAGVPVASSTLPIMDSTAAIGSGTTWARADHIHPTDTSRASVASVPLASSTNPVMDGTVAVGIGTTWARADHVHPVDTSRAAQTSLANYLPLTGGNVSGAINLQSTTTHTGGAYFAYPAASDFQLFGSAQYRIITFAGSPYQLFLDTTTGLLNYTTNNSGGFTVDIGGSMVLGGATGHLTINGQGYKPGGGPWVAPSDERLKRNIADYGAGLAEIMQLRPVSFEYNGEGDTPDDGKTYYGLIAQQARRVMAELVHEMPEGVTLDGSKIGNRLEGQLATDLSPLPFAFINAITELAQRIIALEVKVA